MIVLLLFMLFYPFVINILIIMSYISKLTQQAMALG